MSDKLARYAVKDVPWSTMNPVHRGPRWVVVAVDNVAAGWSDITDEPLMEAYISLYVFDAWRVYHACSAEKLFQLYDCGNYAWIKEEASEEERNRIFDAWEVGVEVHNPLVAVDDMELGQGGTVIAMYPDDGECDEENEREYMKYVDEMVSSIRSNPPV